MYIIYKNHHIQMAKKQKEINSKKEYNRNKNDVLVKCFIWDLITVLVPFWN